MHASGALASDLGVSRMTLEKCMFARNVLQTLADSEGGLLHPKHRRKR